MKAHLSRKSKPRMCAYCGAIGPTSMDHIPPKNLFPPPRTVDLVTVPSCSVCHSGTSMDDEYFRAIVLSTSESEDHPEAEKARDRLMSSLQRPQKKRFLQHLASSVSELEVWSPKGNILLGRKPAIQIDGARLNRVVERIVRGLFFDVQGHPVPKTHNVIAHLKPQVRGGFRQILESIRFNPEQMRGRGAFRFAYQVVPEEQNSSIWVMHFYGKCPAFGFTVLPEELRSAEYKGEGRNTDARGD